MPDLASTHRVLRREFGVMDCVAQQIERLEVVVVFIPLRGLPPWRGEEILRMHNLEFATQ